MAEFLLSAPTTGGVADDSVPRKDVPYKNLSGPFKVLNADFERQYSHTYASRLDQLKSRCGAAVRQKWTDLTLTNRVIDLKYAICVLTAETNPHLSG